MYLDFNMYQVGCIYIYIYIYFFPQENPNTDLSLLLNPLSFNFIAISFLLPIEYF